MKRLFYIFLIFSSSTAQAQDGNFTQFASSPLTLNPANTGLINGDFRAVVNYKNQWNSITVPFITTAISYDMALLETKLNGSSIGVGILGYLNQAGDGKAQNKSAGLSIAYHQKIGKNPQMPQTLSIGFQALLLEKRFEVFDPFSIPIIQYTVKIDPYIDYNAGVIYSGFLNTRSTIYGGVSYHHVLSPVETYLVDNYKVHARVSTMLGGSYKLNNKFKMYYSANYQQQDKAYDVLLGGAVGITLNPKQLEELNKSNIYIGAWYRYNESLAPYLAFEYKKARLGISYDITTNNLTEAMQGSGTFELSLIYNGGFSRYGTFDTNQSYPKL